MNTENASFAAGTVAGAVIVVVTLVLGFVIKTAEQARTEGAKTEHLTIKYKNDRQGVADKELLVNIMKQHFPSSNWSHIDSRAGENRIELDVWNTDR
jgi:hypothetical protein